MPIKIAWYSDIAIWELFCYEPETDYKKLRWPKFSDERWISTSTILQNFPSSSVKHPHNILRVVYKSREKVHALLEKTCPKFGIAFVILISTTNGDDIEGKVYADEFYFYVLECIFTLSFVSDGVGLYLNDMKKRRYINVLYLIAHMTVKHWRDSCISMTYIYCFVKSK